MNSPDKKPQERSAGQRAARGAGTILASTVVAGVLVAGASKIAQSSEHSDPVYNPPTDQPARANEYGRPIQVPSDEVRHGSTDSEAVAAEEQSLNDGSTTTINVPESLPADPRNTVVTVHGHQPPSHE
jgi:hypothetical protein